MHSIEIASRKDLLRVIELFLKRGEEFDFKMFPPPDLESIIETVTKSFLKAPCFLLKVNGEIVGFAGLTLDAFGWNKHQPFLCDYMVYCLPPYRDINIAKLLYGAILEFADFHGLPVHLHYIATDRKDARLRLMRRLGFENTGFLLSRGHYG